MDDTSSAKAEKIECETIQLAPDGDVALVVSGDIGRLAIPPKPESSTTRDTSTSKRFIVSSVVLNLASPYFRRLFSPQFKEGALIRQQHCPDIFLQDDDVDAMAIILSALHLNFDSLRKPLPVHMAVRIANQCDKYQCIDAVRPSLYESLNEACPLLPNLSTEATGLALVSTYLFEESQLFTRVLIENFRKLALSSLSTWKTINLMSLLPEEFIDNLRSFLIEEFQRLEDLLLETMKDLEQSDKNYAVVDESYREMQPDGTQTQCTREDRVQTFKKALEEKGLWPVVEHFQKDTLGNLSMGFFSIHGKIHEKHRCRAGTHCPLQQASKKMDSATLPFVNISSNPKFKELISICKDKGDRTPSNREKKRKFTNCN